MSAEQTVEVPRPELSPARRALIEARLRGQVRSLGIVPRPHREGAPLSFAQERLWFIDRLDPGSTTYNMAWSLRLRGAPDVGALERSLGEIVRRHETLRTTFREVDGSPVQVIAPFAGFALPVEDFSGVAEADRGVEVRRRMTEDAERPFDLAAGPLFRAALLRLGEEDHVLLVGMHHIVSDGWSIGVLSREFSALYQAYREGRESPLPELAVQYADYAAWQREHLRGAVLERQLSYWRERLADAPALLELPTDHPRPAVQTFRGALARIELPGGLLERLRGVGRSEGATLYMVVLSAFQVLLSKYGGSEDVVVGSPMAGRTRKEVEGLIGFFVNTLVLRTDLSGDPSFREVLGRVRETTLGAYEHQELPFEKLVAELQPERSLRHSPLFQVSFTLLDVEETGSSGLAELETEGIDTGLTPAKFDLSLSVAATPRGLRGALSYSTDLFEPGTAERMARHLERVLEQVAADVDARLSRLELLGDAERSLVLEEWNRTAAEYPADRCIHELFAEQAARTPGAEAVVHEGVALSYAELNRRANRLAHHLKELGVGPDARVGLCLERGVDAIVGLLGVLKAGGAYVPLDPSYPVERLREMLADSRPVVLLTQASLRERVGSLGVLAIALDADADTWAERAETDPPRLGLAPEHLAYLIYTSGSTGRPKGVMVRHGSVVNLAAALHARIYAAHPAPLRVGVNAPLVFDGSVKQIVQLVAGHALCLVPEALRRDPAALVSWLEHERVDTLDMTPSLLRLALAEGLGRDGGYPRFVLVGGEAVDEELRERMSRVPTRFHNVYGPTECTVDVTTREIGGAGPAAAIGGPLPNVATYVLDPRLVPVPVGVAGELYVGGAGLARGYLDRPAMTAERFVPDPFGGEAGARLYRTGDRVRWMADGTLEYLGRLDVQVKVRGFRIELGEIEVRLAEHPEVREAVVLAREDAPGDTRLVAYVVGGVETDALRAHLRQSLPEYMVPSAFVALDRLPLTPNGKLDRKALPAPDLASAEERHVAPRTPVEEVLAGIWAEVLRLGRVGVEESFFELGGHSLLATRVVSRIREVFAVELPLRALFEGPTIAEMAVRVEEMRRAELPVLPPVLPTERTGAPPLSFAQERLWFIDQLEPGSATYNIPAAWRLGGALDEAALERSLGEIVRRHEALRTTFSDRDGTLVQVIAPFGGFALPVEELSGLGEADREAAVRRRAGEDAGRPFDLSAGPLFRAALLRLGEEDRVLLLSMHHIVSDGWSMGVLFRELSSLYAAYREGGESPLTELAVQYADYAVWQREQLAGAALERQLSYWRERLAGAPELLELRTDHPRSPERTQRGAFVPVSFSLDLLERLQALGRNEGTTLYMTLLGAFQVLLSKYGGGEDIVVGSPIAGRTRGEVEALIGFFVNTLVLRTDLSGDPSFRETLRRVRETTLGAYEHQEVPFEKLVEELRPERSLSHSPLFQVMFTLQDAGGGGGGGGLPGLRVSGVGAELATAKFDLSLALTATAQGLRGALSYSTDLFEPGTIERMARHLERVLEQVAADADARLSRLELLGEAERALVLEAWNRTEAEYPADRCIHELFEARAARTPGAVAVLFEGTELSYGELNGRANRLAHHLAGLGVGPETRVGICLERGTEMIVSVLAVLKAGGAYVPLDPAHPAERLAFMLADAAVPVLVTQESLRAALPAGDGVAVVSVDGEGDGARIAAESAENPERGVSPGHLAYVIYTSGSTGTPKGVMVPHRGVPNLAYAQARRFGIDAGSRVLQFASLSFDAAVAELFGALLTGATLVLASREDLLPGAGLLETLRRGRVTVATLPPPVLAILPPDDLPELRTVVSAGEAVDAATVERWSAGRAFVNAYGPTETTVCATSASCEADGRAPAIGRPLENVRVYVLDARGAPVPVGVPGELYVGGVGVVRGYLGRPGLTAERFVSDPFGREPGARLYRTGDQARWRADGTLEYLGRLDAQVKVRGFRIEPGEIEAALSAHAEVLDARVIVREDEPGEKRLVAYVVGGAEADGLREHLRRSLPEYMVPSAFVSLDRLPLTPNGKLDRKALPVPEYAADADRYVEPRTPAEEVLAGIWAEVLRLERVGVEESFFELGGHSLLATRVVSRIRELFAVELPLRALFEGPTVAEMARAVEEMRRADLPVLPPVVPVEREGALPLSFAQERLWFIDRLEPGSTTYNVPVAWRLGGALDEAALERALGEIVRRHETLRTTFPERDRAPVQVVASFGGLALPVEDLSTLPEAEREAAVRRRVTEEAARPFDLSAGPLFRPALLRLDAEDHVLLLCMHHILVDQWSMEVLRRELSALYAAFREGGASPLPEPVVQYADYAVWQREQLRGEVLDRHLAYWKERLAGAPELLELPTDRPRPAVQTYRGAHEGITLSGELLARLEALGRGEGATLYMTLLGAFQVLLGRYAGSEDVVVGSPISGRTRREVEELIGLFLNTLVLRTDLSGNPSFREVLRRVREVTLGAFEHQEIPFERLVTELQPGRSLSYSPLFQVMFVLQEAGRSAGAAESLELRSLGAGSSGTSKFDLTLFTGRHTGGLTASLEYNTDLFDRGTIRRMLGHLARVLEEVAADADVRLSELDLLSAEERGLVVAEWNATEAAYPRERCAHELFEAQAERTPGAVALRHAGGSLTYAELEERANRLARHLGRLGVGPDARVGLCLERGPELMVGVLGILKAGGCYVPLDPAYPGERLAYMLEDSAARVLLTQASLAERLPAGGAAVVRLDADAEAIEREESGRPRVPVGPDHLAYVIYTSGSTGRPKGVAMPHRPLVNLLAWQEGSGRAPAGAVTLQFTSISFDVSFQEIFSTWCAGGALVLTSEEVRVDPARLARLLEAEGIERLFLPFIALQHLAEASVELGIAPASLSEVITAGEQLRVTEPIRRWFGRMPGCVLVNQYGPSETHVVSARVLEGEPAGWPPLPSIGAPVANTRLYVLDPHLEPAPIGVPGELMLGGDAVARGYLERPGLTAERFVPDPFGGAGGRLYRTGDRARWLPGGEVEYLGRTDEQVKVRGFRIEPGEVEAVLSDHPEVREAVVVVREDAPGDRRLVAYVVAGEVTPAELRAHLKGRLPEYMVPSAVVALESLPLTPSGKVARRALPAPDFAAAEERHVAPRTPAEEVLAGIWAEVLRLERVGVEESFFELGGHSLLATRVVSRIREVFAIELPLRTLFEGPTVAELAVRVEEMRRAELPVLPPVVPAERTGALPLSFAQERLWFIDRLEPGSATYIIPAALRLAGALDERALERSLGEIVRRHEALRTVFREVDGSPVQVIAPFDGFVLPVEDLSGLGEADREAEVRRRAAAEAARPFDLSQGPLFRATLLRLGGEDHVLLLGMHHIVSDGWSMGVLNRELSSLYGAYREGGESPLPELEVQYADYAVWQREQLEGEVLDRQLSYWRERLSGAPELLELPTDHPRPPVRTYRGASVPVSFSPELLERLQTLGRSEGATLYMTLLGAFQVLLSKYGGGEDVVVGSPIAGRTRGEVEALIGFFINTLVVRTDLSGDPGFREVLRRVREVTLGAYEHQEVPFEKLVAELQPERSLSHSPLFQVMFTLQNIGGGGGALAGLGVSGVGAAMEIAKFDLSLTLGATAQGLRGALNYSTDIFEPGTIERMVGHLERVLEQVAVDADARLSRLDLLAEAERSLVLEEWNRTEAEYPADRCIHELFEAQAARTPGAVAVRFEEASLRYGELNEQANRLAHHLVGLGVGPEVRVGICLERSLEMVVGILAVLKAGGAYVPLDPAYPAERLAFILADSATPVLLTREELRGALPAREGVEVVSLDGAASEIAAESAENPESGAGPDSLAYVIYTSGSTGTPKGALIEHRNVARLFSATDPWFGFGESDVWTLFHSYAFDFSVWEIWGALLHGGRVVIVPLDVTRDPEAFHALVRREGVTVLSQTPSAFRQLIRVDGERGGDLALRVVVFGGEALEPASLREWVERRGAETPRLVNMYGITETTVHVTYRPLGHEDVFGGSGSPIGRAIPDLRLYVLDPARRPVPIGVPGELYVGGAGVARGYLNRPELTAERFVDDPFAPGRLYRTGDRVRWRADGTLEYLGRLDEQVKIRGFRIELGEIEAALRQAPGVTDCTVVAREDAPGDRQLVAYVVGGVETDALRTHLRQGLPEYMVPSAFVVLDRLLLTPNGKVDRKALPAPDLGSAEEKYVAPRTPVEEVLAGIWAEVLRLERVGVEESFFELGGHSLLATRVVSRIRAVFGVELPLRALFEGPTVAEMAVRVEEMRRAELPVLPPVVPTERTGALPLSFAQERLWFIDQLEPGSAVYNIPMAWRLGGALDQAALERSLGEIVRRHEALRTVFAEVEGSPVQVVAPFGELALSIDDLSRIAAGDREAEVRRRAGEEARRAFDLSAGPLFRAALLRVDAEDHVLLLSMHHIVSDGWSMGVLFRELSALYEAYREGGESPLPEPAVQYADYAVWQREQLEGAVLDRQLSYWKEQLSGAPELLELPTDRPRPAVQTYRGESVGVSFSPELLERLRALGRSEGATLYMTLLGAFQVLLSKYGGGEDIVVGSPIAGRTRGEVEALIGFFVNTLVLRTDLSGDPGFREVLRRVREVTLGAYEHQEVPFEKLVAELQPERSLSHSPLFQVSFTVQDAGGGGGGLPGLTIGGVGAAMEIAKFDLSLTFGVSAHGLHGALNYSTDLFERGTVERMLGHLSRVLEQVTADADVRLSRLALTGPEERARVVEEWNRTDRAYPRGVCVHELFEAQVRERPGAVALAWGGTELTYRDLDAAANQLAHHLVRVGVGPDARVGVLLERSAELIVSILAVLKAGGCYVPLDPSYPPERLRLMLADSSVRVLLSRSELAGEMEGGDLEIVHLDHAAAALASEPIEAPRGGATAENLAYIVYTSGSTGKPKGVMVAHRHVVQLVVETDYVRLRPGDRIAQASNASFDALTFEAWGAFLNGATLVGIPRDVLLSPPALYRMLRDERITTLYQTTALLNQLSREQPDVFAPLRDVLFGGQAVDADSVRRLLKAGGPERLLHMYGPTETTAWCSWEQVEHVAEDALTVSVGRPTGNQRIYLLDAALNPVPVGVPGEAYVGGDGVVRGYLDRPGLTAERFVPDPFAAEPGVRMYRTGDRLRWKADGRLEFIGRVDEQVKIRGFRIEPGEIEAVLSAHAEVREARVLVSDDASGEKRLVAYVVGHVEAEELRAHLRESLPEYMVPAAFVALDALPLTPNGKLDVRALPAPELGSAEGQSVAPRTPVEEVLAEIWAEVLRLERVGVHESFFELGGHSLMAIRVVSRIRAVFAIELPLRALFEGPTVAELATAVEEMRRAELPVLPPVAPTGRTGALPLSFAQERLWFIDRLDPDSAAYNIPVAWRLGGVLDEAAMERALGEIVRRHEALRTTFAEVDGSPVQVIAPFGGFALAVEDLSGLAEADREAAVRRRAAEEAGRPFDLSAGPVFRAALLRLGGEDHVLLLSMHHIVSDGWSMGVLFRELSSLYQAYHEGRESPLPELAVQYADYAAWQREHLRGEMLELQLSYWRDRLGDAPALLEIPTDHPRPAVQTFRGASERIDLSGELLERLRGLGRSEGATLYMVVLAAFQVLLSRYSGSEDIVVGSPIAGRTRKEVEELIGFFVNTLVLRTDLGGDPSFREVLGRVREATLGAYEHQELPFEKLVAELQPERSLSHSPLFQVSFTLGDAEEAAGGLAELSTAGVDAGFEHAKFDLLLALVATRRGLRGGLSYRTDLFERGTIVRLLGHLERVLEQVAHDPARTLSRLELLGEAERLLVVEEWNRTEAAYPADRCIHELFEARAARTPDAVAVEFEGETVDYRTLNERANRLAHHLAGLGVGPETRVGICLERGTEMIVSVLAVLKAGGAYVPLDPAYPAERLAFVLSDAAVPVLVTQESLRAALPGGDGVAVVSVDGDGESIAAESAENPKRGVSPDHLAYVIYTSGSTGTPKGVMVPHRGVPNLAYAQARRFGIDGTSRVLQFASPSFDAAVAELFDALLTGATLVMASREDLLPGAGLLETLRRGRVTVATLPPSVLAILPPDGLPELRTVVSAGEAVDAATVERWSEGRAFVNAYGPTEITVCATSARCEADGRAPAIGRPLENVRVYVLDATGRPAPMGVPGELYVGGVGVVRGYLGRPGLTAERFVPDPFGREPGARLYRTGDRARWLDGGTLEYLGRLDAQVKVRGFRIEPGEVEAALRRNPGVTDCVVMAREDQPGDRRLVAYVVGGAETETLRAHLRQSLPDYMVPSAFVPLDALPLTPNGKIDRRALPAPELGAGEDRAAPRTPTEEILAGVWGELLGMDGVGADDEFFALGGHSLLATRLVSKIREAFGVEMAIRTVFEDSVLSALAARVDEALRADDGVRLPPLLPREDGADAPLSFSQERLWLLQRITPRSPAYKISTVLRFGGALDAGVMERVVAEIVRRHHVLRTVIVQTDAGPVQRVASTDLHLPLHDFSSLPADRAEAEARELARREWMTPFEVEGGALFRAMLIRIAADDHVLHLAAHHTVFDGWSAGVLQRELAELHDAFSKGEPSPLADLPVQYADYAAWQRGWMTDEAAERQVDYWRGRLDGAPPLLELPTDRPRPAVQGYGAGTVDAALPPALVEGVRALARREGATPFMVLLAALDVVLSRWSGQEDLVIGTQVAGRTHAGTEPLIGVFLNTLAIRADLSGAPTFRELLGRVREATLGAYAHQDVPFERVLDSLRLPRSLGHSPVFQVMVNYQNFGARSPAPAGLERRPFGAVEPTSKVDMTLYASEDPQGVGLALVYSAELFQAPRMRELLAQMTAVLGQAVVDANRPVAEMPLRTAEAAAILPDPSEPLDRAWRGSVPEIFARRAAERPGALAVADPLERWTYAELDAATARIARRLVEGGVRPGDTVTIWAHRSAAMVRAMVGVLRAGAAFVALDPAYPPARLAEYVRIAQPRGFLRIAAAGAVPAEVEDALSATATVTVELGSKSADGIDGVDGWGSMSPDAEKVEIGPDSLAYLSFTSGTTGAPKAVMGRHGSLTHFTPWLAERFGLAAEDRFSLLSGLAHDPLHRDVFTPLQLGASIIAPDPVGVGTPGYLGRWMAEAEVTVAHLTPAMGQLLADTSDSGGDGAGSMPKLRRAFFVGDVLVRGDVARLHRLAPNVTVINYYGSTETQRAVSYHVVDPQAADTAKPIVPLGRGIPGVQLLVRSANGALAGIGELGEVWLRSPHVALGYRGDAELTAARFVPNPWTGDAGDGMYRTGDLGRYGPDGEVEPAGRADQQVKVRGFRIELGEVEAALGRHAAVREAIVMARGEGDAKRLVAWLTSTGERPGSREMRDHLRALLPDFMVPSAFVWLDALPLTPNGKVDRRALPDPASPATAAPAAPRTVTERVIVEIWMEVLGVESVGVEDDFFVLGGHSLKATQVLVRISQVLEVELPLRALFQAPTVAGLAAAVQAAGGGAIADALAELEALSDEEKAALLAEIGEEA